MLTRMGSARCCCAQGDFFYKNNDPAGERLIGYAQSGGDIAGTIELDSTANVNSISDFDIDYSNLDIFACNSRTASGSSPSTEIFRISISSFTSVGMKFADAADTEIVLTKTGSLNFRVLDAVHQDSKIYYVMQDIAGPATGSELRSVDFDGNNDTQLINGIGQIQSIRVNTTDDKIVVVNQTDLEIQTYDLDGTDKTVLLSIGTSINFLSVDYIGGRYLYMNGSGTDCRSIDFDGTGDTSLFTTDHNNTPHHVSQKDGFLYYVDNSSDLVYRDADGTTPIVTLGALPTGSNADLKLWTPRENNGDVQTPT